MRLKSIELHDDFRSLKSGFRLDFIKELPSNESAIEPYCIVGRNGSGKSNILELLSAIFFHVEVSCLEYLPKDIITKINEDEEEYEEREELNIFQSFTTSPNAFKLEYYSYIDAKETLVTIEKRADEYRKVYLEGDSENLLDKKELQDRKRGILPENIIGYSSGQNEILSLPFYKMRLIQYDEYVDRYLAMGSPIDTHESRMIYLDDAFSQAIFITNFIYTDEKVNKIFKENVGVESVESFRIVIKYNLATNIIVEKSNGLGKKLKLLNREVCDKINKLQSCATMQYKNKETKELYLDYYLDETVKEAFRLEFGEGKEGRLNLFQTFQILINLNYYHIKKETKLKLYNTGSLYAKGYLPQSPWNERFFGFKYFNLKKVGIKDTVLSKSLSDGEYQFLHSIGLSLIYRDTQSLFLLDEPETHFNPSWRAEYMSVLKECFNGIKTKAEFLITSHSPFIVSDTKEEKVLLFKKDKKGEVKREKLSFNTFGASVDKITAKIFGQNSNMGDLSLDILEEYRDKIDNSKDLEALVKDIESELGESIEKFLLVKSIFDRIEKGK